MVIVGLPYTFQGQMGVKEVTGCSPYGASTIADGDGSRQPSENELAGARYQAAMWHKSPRSFLRELVGKQ